MEQLIAGAFLQSSFQVIFEKLASVDIRDYFSNNNLDELVEKLVITLNSINYVLEEAEIKQYQNKHVKKWLDELKHVVYDADQVLDEIATDAMLIKMKAEDEPITATVFGYFPALTTNPFECRLNEQLDKLELLAKQKKELRLGKGPTASNEGLVSLKPSKRLSSTTLVDESRIYGRDVDKTKLIKFLLENNGSGDQVPIISVVGLGGIGKTTLAKLVYNDIKIEEYFELQAWVYVSESFDVVGLTKAILKSFNSSADGEDLNLLQRQLQQMLMGKKYLLVLDDIWNGDAECWELLLLPFNHGSSGSKIIVTTREKEVAEHVLNSTKLFDLHQLDKSNCWSLFVTHAFHGKNVCEHQNLESIGRKIVDKCGGLPLAIKSLGQLLRKKFSPQEWNKILETDMWRLSDVDRTINSVLRLSYHNLHSELKRCFAYCSIFPKGYEFEKDELIKLWMAEGLLECCGSDKSQEEFGKVIFCYLESISFFQKSIDKIYGTYQPYVMHDLVNDLTKSVSGEFCIQIEGARVESSLEKTRHIWCSLQSNCVDDKSLKPICELTGLRSLILQGCTGVSINKEVQRDLFSGLKYLRMLKVIHCGLSELVDEISNLKLLRYLDLSYTEIKRLPDSICMLYNLQTLVLKGCHQLTELPSNFSKLINLRHLELPFIKKMPKHMGKLNNLQTLNYFIVEERNGSELKELAKLNHLHGTIHIKVLGNVIDLADAVTASLKDKKYLEELYIQFNCRREEMDESNVLVLEALQPNNNLKKLTITQYKGSRFPNWLRGCHLPNLVSLELMGCRCSCLPPLGQLPSLKKLSIYDCEGIKIIDEQFYGNNSTIVPFKSLEVLKFWNMVNWEEWISLRFPLLKELYITDCPKLKGTLPQHLPSIQKLSISGCKELEEWLCLEGFLSLKEFYISDCSKFKRVLPQQLPSLQKLWINSCNELEDWLCLGEFPLLKEISISYCPELKRALPQHLPSLQNLSINNCSKLEELLCFGEFPLLKEISISDCPELKRALPQHLPSLQKLKISDCSKMEASIPKFDSIIEFDIQRCDRIFLNELPSSLKKLIIHENRSTEFSVEQNLVNNTILEVLELDFRRCVNCPSLGLCCYDSLSKLSITGWGSSSLPFSLHLFTSLDTLYLYDCPELESFPMGGLPSNLWRLEISNCPKLIGSREEWGLFQLNSLTELWVSDEFENVESFPEENLLPLTLYILTLNNCSKLRIMNNKGFLHLKSLNYLYIKNCPSLERLPEKEALPNSLSTMFIYNLSDCPKLESFPMGGLPSNLSLLYIKNCPKLNGSREEWGLFQLNSLQVLSVSDCEFENVESFPEENLLPPTLLGLYLRNCSKLRIMNNKGFLHLKSLKNLVISNCPSLECLPEKEALPNSLFWLEIKDCPIIKEKYEKEGGERWHTISHIPEVTIDHIIRK